MKRGFAMIVLVLLACGSSNQGQKVDGGDQAPAPEVTIYAPGDTVQVESHTIVLNEARFEGDVLHADFTIQNQGSDELNVSSLLNFSARAEDGRKLAVTLSCGPMVDGKVLTGDRIRGEVCWKDATAPVKIYYRANLIGEGAVVWEVKE